MVLQFTTLSKQHCSNPCITVGGWDSFFAWAALITVNMAHQLLLAADHSNRYCLLLVFLGVCSLPFVLLAFLFQV